MLILKKKNIIITSILIAITLGITFLLIFMCNNVLKKEEEANKTNPQLIYEALKKEDRILEVKTTADITAKDGTYLVTIFYPSESNSIASINKIRDMQVYDYYVILYSKNLVETLLTLSPSTVHDYWIVDNHSYLYQSNTIGKEASNIDYEITQTKEKGTPVIDLNTSKVVETTKAKTITFISNSPVGSNENEFNIKLRTTTNDYIVASKFVTIEDENTEFVIVTVTNDYDSTERNLINLTNFTIESPTDKMIGSSDYVYSLNYNEHSYKTIQIHVYDIETFNTLSEADSTKALAVFNYQSWM